MFHKKLKERIYELEQAQIKREETRKSYTECVDCGLLGLQRNMKRTRRIEESCTCSEVSYDFGIRSRYCSKDSPQCKEWEAKNAKMITECRCKHCAKKIEPKKKKPKLKKE